MTIALCLLAFQGVIGAFDTIYYHEWKAHLPARGRAAAAELKLHAIRDFLYTVIFASLPWLAWRPGTTPTLLTAPAAPCLFAEKALWAALMCGAGLPAHGRQTFSDRGTGWTESMP